jgi:ammonia channel protein AmtB
MKEFIETTVAILILSAAIAFIGWMGYNIGTANKPTAMDVYQGKTTLEITYRDSVAIDSVVVFKNKVDFKSTR